MKSSAEIWYYAWISDPHVTVWKERIRIFRLESGEEGDYRVISSVEIPMYNARYATAGTEKTQASEDIWLPDLGVWNANAY